MILRASDTVVVSSLRSSFCHFSGVVLHCSRVKKS